MTSKAQFNAEEWSEVIQAPMLAAMLVLAASRGGTIREAREIAKVYAEVRRQGAESALLDAIVGDRAVVQPAQARHQPEALRDEGMSHIRKALAIVDRIATEDEANEYRRFIWALADRTARAHREGGVLGLGGKEVSDAERAVLDELAAAFDEHTGGPPPVSI